MNKTTNFLEYMEQIAILTDEWSKINFKLWNECEFDTDNFEKLIRKTREFFLPYCDDINLPKDTIEILLKINQFSNHPEYISDTLEACKLIANGLIKTITSPIPSTQYLLKEGKFWVRVNYIDVEFDIEKFDIDSIAQKMQNYDFDVFGE